MCGLTNPVGTPEYGVVVSKPTDEIRALTGIRALAAMWVVFFHMRVGGLRTPAFAHGYLGVDVFFVLSGYILALAHGRDFVAGVRDGAARFVMLRFARVFPAYAAVLVLLAAASPFVAALRGPGWSRSDFILSLLMLQAWETRDALVWNRPGWSVSAEWAAYLAFPTLAWAILPRFGRVARGALGLVALVTLAVYAERARGGSLDLTFHGGLVRVFCEFVFGLCLATDAPPIRSPRVATVVASGALVGLFAVGWAGTLDALAPALSGLLIVALRTPDSVPARLFGAPVAVHAGKLSYAVYLVHWPLLRAGTRLVDHAHFRRAPLVEQVLVVAVEWALILVCAEILHRCIEEPARRALRAWIAPARNPTPS